MSALIAKTMDLVAAVVGIGVPTSALAMPQVPMIRSVVFNGNTFEDCDLGDKAFVFAEGDDEIAWEPFTGKLANCNGIAWALGREQLGRDGMGTTGRALPIRRAPRAWLRSHRLGVCIVDYRLAARVLAGCTIEAEDEAHARELRRLLRLQLPTVLVARSLPRAA